MPDDEEIECAPSKRKFLNWTPLAFLNSLGHTTGFSTSKAFNKEKVIQDWISWNFQQLGLPIPHLLQFKDHACTCDRFAIDEYGEATAMRIDIAPHKRPRRKQTRHVPDPHYFHLPPHARLHY
jgi:hypothetical protein